eukprot:scaffold14510_cov76-Phaeocystis_antarctica.AAC.1
MAARSASFDSNQIETWQLVPRHAGLKPRSNQRWTALKTAAGTATFFQARWESIDDRLRPA